MSNKIILASDSTTDLGPELIEKYQIQIIPLGVTLGTTTYSDGIDITPDAIYDHYAKTGELPKTSAANLSDFDTFLTKLTADGDSVLLFTISSDMSSTCQNAKLAAEEHDNVYVVDTKSLSTGGGLLVLAAADMIREGKSAKEIALACEELTEKVDASFVIDNLEFLHKGGRCSSIAALGANLLQLKPCIVVRNGKMLSNKKYRGRFGDVLKKYISEQLADPSDIDTKRVFITHGGCNDDILEQCVKQVKDLGIFEEVHATRAGCTVSSHCGKDTLGVIFIRKSAVQ